MAKKGVLFHWIIFGVLAALGIFLFMTLYAGETVKTKGEWPVDFLKQSYYPVEKELLKIDFLAKEAGLALAKELAEKGGFTEDTSCGQFKSTALWNNKKKTCYPEIALGLTKAFNQKFSEFLPGIEFLEVTFSGTLLLGKGKPETKIITEKNYQKYVYETGFQVNLGYSFEEYSELKIEASKLLNTCRNSKLLSVCIKETKPENWKDESCQTESFSEERKTVFCVISASNSVIEYHFSLDFTPSEALAISAVKVSKSDGKYQITFEQDSLAESYILHYTNWPEVETKSGLAADIFSDMPSAEGFGYFHQTMKLSNPKTENCPADKQPNTVYLCAKEIVYSLEDNTLEESKEYWFGLVSLKEGKESEIVEWVKS